MSEKPKIYGTCKAGCLWETVHKDDFDRCATWIKQYADEDGIYSLSPIKTYKINSSVSSNAYSCVVSLSYTDGTAQLHTFAISEFDEFRNYFYFEILNITASSTRLIIVYEINGNRYKETVSGSAIDITDAKLKVADATSVYLFNADASISADAGEGGGAVTSVNGQTGDVTIDVPTKTSDLTNDSGFVTSDYHDSTKQDALKSGTNIKTINGKSILGSGNLEISGGGGSGVNTTNGFYKYNGVIAESPSVGTTYSDSYVDSNTLYPSKDAEGNTYAFSNGQAIIDNNGVIYYAFEDNSCVCVYIPQSGSGGSGVTSVNGQTGDVTIDVPTKTSELTNDSDFVTSDYHDSTKQDALKSGTNIKTINGNSILGSGNLEISGGGGSGGTIYQHTVNISTQVYTSTEYGDPMDCNVMFNFYSSHGQFITIEEFWEWVLAPRWFNNCGGIIYGSNGGEETFTRAEIGYDDSLNAYMALKNHNGYGEWTTIYYIKQPDSMSTDSIVDSFVDM